MSAFTQSDLQFLKAIGVSAAPSFADKRMELAERIGRYAPPGLPPIPDLYFRIRARDRTIWDIPVWNIVAAREIDPKLNILNPDDYWG